MMERVAADSPAPCEPEIGENGVDLASLMTEFISALVTARARNEARATLAETRRRS
jgi:hypothetical protein